MLHRLSDFHGDIVKGAWSAFKNIGYGKTARSPLEGEALAMYRPGIDEYVMNRDRLLSAAVQAIGELRSVYAPVQRPPLPMPGRSVYAEMCAWLEEARERGRLMPHDVTTGTQIAMIVTGGDIAAGEKLSENELCALERQAFLALAQTEQTRARIEHMLEHGKPLRN